MGLVVPVGSASNGAETILSALNNDVGQQKGRWTGLLPKYNGPTVRHTHTHTPASWSHLTACLCDVIGFCLDNGSVLLQAGREIKIKNKYKSFFN